MAHDTVLLTELYPYIEKAFADKSKINEIEKIFARYIDKNVDKLSTTGPTKMLYFTDKDMTPIYELVGVSESFVKSLRDKSKDLKSAGQILKYPFRLLMPMIIRYAAIKKNGNMLNMSIAYLALSMYPMLFYKYFKYEPNENVMNYTVNNLSNKYKIRQTGNLYAAIHETADGAYTLHEKDIIRGYDVDIADFVSSIRTRLNSFLKKISIEFYKNQKDGKYLNLEFESNDEENFREADASIYAVDRIVNKVTLKLIVDGPPITIITIAAKNNKVSVNELRNYVNNIVVSENTEDIKTIIESILFMFIFDGKNTVEEINSDKFVIHCLDIYKRSNTTDQNVIKIKKILDKWLENLGTYKKTQRLATINNFRRALYTFFVLSIQYANVR